MKIKISRGLSKKKLASSKLASYNAGYEAGIQSVIRDFDRRLTSLEKTNLESITIEALRTWYGKGNN